MAWSTAGPSLPRDLNSSIRGYFAYEHLWPNPFIGEKLICQAEPENEYDENAIAVKKDGVIVGHVPRESTNYFGPYMQQPGTELIAMVTGEVTNNPTKGTEIPCIYGFKAKDITARKREGSADHRTVFNASSSEESDGLSADVIMSTDGDDDLPNELENLDPSMIDMYLKALKDGKEKQNTVRVMVVGCAGVGKTTLTRNLMEMPTVCVQSTNGIEVYKCFANSANGKWKRKIDDANNINRLVSVASTLSSYDSSETLVVQDDQYAKSLDHDEVTNTNESASCDTSERKSQVREPSRLPLKKDSSHLDHDEVKNTNQSSLDHDEIKHTNESASTDTSERNSQEHEPFRLPLNKDSSSLDHDEVKNTNESASGDTSDRKSQEREPSRLPLTKDSSSLDHDEVKNTNESASSDTSERKSQEREPSRLPLKKDSSSLDHDEVKNTNQSSLDHDEVKHTNESASTDTSERKSQEREPSRLPLNKDSSSLDHDEVKNTNESASSDTSERKSKEREPSRLPLKKDSSSLDHDEVKNTNQSSLDHDEVKHTNKSASTDTSERKSQEREPSRLPLNKDSSSLDHDEVKNTNESASTDTSERKSQEREPSRLPLDKDSTMHDQVHHSDETKFNQDSKKDNHNKFSKANVLHFASVLMKEKTENQDKLINIWDFGGQFIFYATHQLFHTRRAIYLLVLDLSADFDKLIKDEDFPEGQKEKDVKSYIKFWMHSVHSYVGTLDGEPPVILVGTHKDKLGKDEKSQSRVTEDCFDNVRELFDETPVLKHIQSEHFPIDNLSTDKSSVQKLRSYIVNVAECQKSWNLEIPAKWIPLESSLIKSKRKHITFEEICEIDAANEVPIEDLEQLKLFLTYHHQMGTFIYFNEEGVSDFVVLEPQWLIDAFKCIITSGRFCKVRPSLRGLWKRLMQEAVLVPELIDEVWGNSKKNDFIQHKNKLLLYLSKTGIVSEVNTFDIETKQRQKMDFFIVPSLLNSHSSKSNTDAFLRSRKSTLTWLVFRFENECVSPTLYHRITAAALGMWSVVKYEGKHLLFENVGVYELDIVHVGVIERTDKTIEILVINLCENAVDCRESDRLRRMVEMVMRHELGKESQYTLCIRCNIRKRGNEIKEMNFIKRSGYFTVPCPDQIAGHNIDVKAMMKEWFPDSKMDGIVDLLKLESGQNFDREVTEKEANQIAKAIIHNWEVLGIALGVPSANIEQIKMNNTHSSRLQIFYMLNTWWKQEANNATLERLLRAMEDEDDVQVNWDLVKNILDRFPH